MEIVILIYCIIVRLKSKDCTLEKKVDKGRFQNRMMTDKNLISEGINKGTEQLNVCQ